MYRDIRGILLAKGDEDNRLSLEIIEGSADLDYSVFTEVEGIGEIKYTRETVNGNETVKFDTIAGDGYKLDSIVVVDSTDKEVPFTDNVFDMPDSDVTIKAVFVKVVVVDPEPPKKEEPDADADIKNPQTLDTIVIVVLLAMISGAGVYAGYRVIKKAKKVL